MQRSTAPAAVVAVPSPVQLTAGCFVSVALALAVLARHRWGPLLETSLAALPGPSPLRQAVPLYIAIDIGQAYVLWLFNRFLSSVSQYRGADRPVLVLMGVLCVDVIALGGVLVSGSPGFSVYPIPLGVYGMLVSYPHFAYVGLGVALSAFGYSLLRAPDDFAGWLRPYAQVQIATGAMLAAPPLAGVWPFAAAAGYVLLAIILFRVAVDPATRLAAARQA